MKITEVETFVWRGWRECVLVRIHTDKGIVGIGEGTCGTRTPSVVGAIDEIKHYLVGQDPTCIEHLWQTMYRAPFWRHGDAYMSAVSAVDIALWDIFGKMTGLPVYKLLGGPTRDKIRVYTHIRAWRQFDGVSTDEIQSDIQKLKDMGFRGFKIVPFGPTHHVPTRAAMEKSVEKIKWVREAIGEECDLMLDFQGRLTHTASKMAIEMLEGTDILFIEEPCMPEYARGLAELRQCTSIPIAAGERIRTRWEWRDVLEQGCVAVAQPDICRAGGFSETRRVAALCEAYLVSMATHSPQGAICNMASLHLDAAIPNFLTQEMSYHGLGEGMIQQRIEIQDGYAILSDRPGLGVDLVPDDEMPSNDCPMFVEQLFLEDGSVADC